MPHLAVNRSLDGGGRAICPLMWVLPKVSHIFRILVDLSIIVAYVLAVPRWSFVVRKNAW